MKFDHNNISPLDNRYLSKIEDIRSIFSEYSLLKTRFLIEINWLLYLCQKYPNYFSKLSNQSKNKIIKFRDSFDDKSVLEIKKIEKVTNHDVKAVEYYIKNFFKKKGKHLKISSKLKISLLVKHLISLLESKDFFLPKEKKHSMIVNINNLIYRLEPNDKELRILASIISSLGKKNQ